MRDRFSERERERMLQRAASNAYSWWWASHIRTRQSNWLEQNLQDMEVKIQNVLKLIEEDGDSFAKRAEMYYKKRPELIHFVEEFYRAYRSLAERYDHISGELHNARSSMATVFPGQVPFAIPNEDLSKEKVTPVTDRAEFSNSLSRKPPPPPPPPSLVKKSDSNASKTIKTSISSTSDPAIDAAIAQKEIQELQKESLMLQTEKEFVKSSYEAGLAKYWELEKQILEVQATMCFLQEEHGLGNGIEVEEEQTLMAVTALRSCEKMLGNLQEEQQKSMAEMGNETERIKQMEKDLILLKDEFLKHHSEICKLDDEEPKRAAHPAIRTLEEEVSNLKKEKTEYQAACQKIVKHLEIDANDSLSIHELSQLIDELVNKVVTLEAEVSSQTAQITRLKSEADQLQGHLRSLQEDKVSLLDNSKIMHNRIKDLEEELHGILDLSLHIEEQKAQIQASLTEACCKHEDLTEKMKGRLKQDEDESSALAQSENKELAVKLQEEKDPNGTAATKYQEVRDVKSGQQTEESNPGGGSEEVVEEPNSVFDLVAKLSEDAKEILTTEHQEEKDVKNGMQTEQSNIRGASREVVEETDSEVDAEAKWNEDAREILTAECQKVKYVKNGMRTEESNINGALPKATEISGPQFDAEAESREESSSELDAEVKHRVVPETDIENVSTDCELKLSLELVDAQTWQRFLEGMEDREKTLLAEYTSILRNHKETKRKLSELEKQNQDTLAENMAKIRVLEMESAQKDEEIQSLKHSLSILQTGSEHPGSKFVQRSNLVECTANSEDSNVPPIYDACSHQYVVCSGDQISQNGGVVESSPTEKEIKIVFSENAGPPSAMEEKFRRDIDGLLEENLEFWLRFSTSFHQIQKFQRAIQESQVELLKLRKEKNSEDSCNHSTSSTSTSSPRHNQSVKSSVEAIQRQLAELQGELLIWLEQNALLKDELKHRFSSLCNIQEELSHVSKKNPKNGGVDLTDYQAAKFQGEVLNMQQENNRVADELQAGLDHVRGLQLELEKTLLKLKENFGLSDSKHHHHFSHYHINYVRNTLSRRRIPLRSFIFGSKPKKASLFSCVSPALQKQYSDLRAGM